MGTNIKIRQRRSLLTSSATLVKVTFVSKAASQGSGSRRKMFERSLLKSYEAIYQQGQVPWLSDQPQVTSARVIITIVEEILFTEQTMHRVTPSAIAGKGQTLGDLVSRAAVFTLRE